jgi:hypothetical protein
MQSLSQSTTYKIFEYFDVFIAMGRCNTDEVVVDIGSGGR